MTAREIIDKGHAGLVVLWRLVGLVLHSMPNLAVVCLATSCAFILGNLVSGLPEEGLSMWIEALQDAFLLLAIWAFVALGADRLQCLLLFLLLLKIEAKSAILGLKLRYLLFKCDRLRFERRKLIIRQREALAQNGGRPALGDELIDILKEGHGGKFLRPNVSSQTRPGAARSLSVMLWMGSSFGRGK
jgi:hypothetical protein